MELHGYDDNGSGSSSQSGLESEDEDEVQLVELNVKAKATNNPKPSANAPAKETAPDIHKRLKLGDGQGLKLFDTKFAKSIDHQNYERSHPVGAGIFGTLQIIQKGPKNLTLKCTGCDWERVGSIGIGVEHLRACKLPQIGELTRKDHRTYLDREVNRFTQKYARDRQGAIAKREVINPNVPTLFKDTQSRRNCLLQAVSRASIACNWPMLQGENPYFRQMVYEISQMRLNEEDLEILKRHAISVEMVMQSDSCS